MRIRETLEIANLGLKTIILLLFVVLLFSFLRYGKTLFIAGLPNTIDLFAPQPVQKEMTDKEVFGVNKEPQVISDNEFLHGTAGRKLTH